MNKKFFFTFVGLARAAETVVDCTQYRQWVPTNYNDADTKVFNDGTAFVSQWAAAGTDVPNPNVANPWESPWVVVGPCDPSSLPKPDVNKEEGWRKFNVPEPATTYFSPYTDATVFGEPGGKDFDTTPYNRLVLAFVNADTSCAVSSLSWAGNDMAHCDSQIAAMRAQGREVTIALGGAFNADFASMGCTKEQVVDLVSALIDKYGTEWLDFDIEAAISTGADVRAAALVEVADKYPGIGFSFTVPVAPFGLTADVAAMLTTLKDLPKKSLSIMAMCFGQSCDNYEDETDCIIESAKNSTAQAAAFWDQPEEDVYRNLVVIPQIGQNGGPIMSGTWEVFPVSGVSKLVAFAKEKNIRALSMWSVTRDQPGTQCDNGFNFSGCNNGGQPAQTELWEYGRTFIEQLYQPSS